VGREPGCLSLLGQAKACVVGPRRTVPAPAVRPCRAVPAPAVSPRCPGG
jgi:hypothetical protein